MKRTDSFDLVPIFDQGVGQGPGTVRFANAQDSSSALLCPKAAVDYCAIIHIMPVLPLKRSVVRK